jgi:DNA-binding NtrC family response regulator
VVAAGSSQLSREFPSISKTLKHRFSVTGECLSKNRILVIDADPVVRSGICNYLATCGQTVAEAATEHDAQMQLQKFRPDAAVLDFSFSNGNTLHLLRHMRDRAPSMPVIALLSQSAADAAIRAIENGAEQFLHKPVEPSLLHAVLLRVLTSQRHRQTSPAALSPSQPEGVDPFRGSSRAIRQMRELATRVADSESPVLLQGETGSGKGVMANWIHHNGPRSQQAFLDLNCAGLSRELLESELFGHEKGAFTSALNAKQGLIEVADRGTVFLDEIGDIDLQVQPKLLKVLENHSFRRLGDVRDRAVNIRLISATHRDLLDLVRQQKFRSDLYFRINIVPLRVPALRERPEDIPVLAQFFLSQLSQGHDRSEMVIEKPAYGSPPAVWLARQRPRVAQCAGKSGRARRRRSPDRKAPSIPECHPQCPTVDPQSQRNAARDGTRAHQLCPTG